MTYTITLTGPTSIDAVGFRARRAGLEVRDCLLILEPGNKARLGLLAKRETASTVVEGYVRQETGVLDLDRCRISSVGDHKRPLQPTKNARNVYGAQTAFMPTNAEGRFPANMIFMHGPTCTCEGTKKVKGGTAHKDNQKSKGTGIVYAGAWNPKGVSGTAGYTSEDGTEEVPNWICEPTCPVRILDEQSGLNCGASSTAKSIKGPTSFNRVENGPSSYISDVYHSDGRDGGASRFFKQVQEEGELDAYLNTLVREYPNE